MKNTTFAALVAILGFALSPVAPWTAAGHPSLWTFLTFFLLTEGRALATVVILVALSLGCLLLSSLRGPEDELESYAGQRATGPIPAGRAGWA